MRACSRFILLVLISTFLFACRSSQQETIKREERKEVQKPPDVGHMVPPGHCRILATVVSISDMLSSRPDDPCAKTPCRATIKIDKVIGYGSAFNAPLSEGSQFEVKFRSTVGDLKVGSKFQADMSHGESVASIGLQKEPTFTVEAVSPR